MASSTLTSGASRFLAFSAWGATLRPATGKWSRLSARRAMGCSGSFRWDSWPTKVAPSCGEAFCSTAPSAISPDADWGDLDYLLIDLPPGTGDVQMGLARMLPRTEMLVVTTPPLAAQKVAARAADIARRGYLRVAGVIENMSDFTCEHGTTYSLFGTGGGARLAGELGVPSSAPSPSIPIWPRPVTPGCRLPWERVRSPRSLPT